MTLTQTNRNPKVCASSHVAGGYTKGWSVHVLVCSVFSDLGTRRQHQPQQPGVSTGDPPGGCRHIQPTRWVVLTLLHHFDTRCELNRKTFFLTSTETGLEERHMAFCGLFSNALALLNGVGVSTGEALAAHVNTWLDRKGRGFPILPLLTACSRCLASVRHMTRIMEACITAYFNHGKHVNRSSFVNMLNQFPTFV